MADDGLVLNLFFNEPAPAPKVGRVARVHALVMRDALILIGQHCCAETPATTTPASATEAPRRRTWGIWPASAWEQRAQHDRCCFQQAITRYINAMCFRRASE